MSWYMHFLPCIQKHFIEQLLCTCLKLFSRRFDCRMKKLQTLKLEFVMYSKGFVSDVGAKNMKRRNRWFEVGKLLQVMLGTCPARSGLLSNTRVAKFKHFLFGDLSSV